MNLFKVFASLVLDTSEYEQGLEDSEKEARSFGSRISSGLATAGKVIGGAVAAGGAAVGALTTQAINGYAAYEQLVGGVETLFGKSARKVEDFANIAFKTAGLSANEYMETVTSFSASLLQSLGGDTAKAADYADTAIRDMSDNANKMGTSMGMIQNAYQGFAKQNYSMLDNLALGYGGSKGEMERLMLDAEKLNESFKATRDENGDLALSYADVVDAIHIVQQNMGITGTTAKEAAGTISGSAGSVKAAWQNLVVSLANDNADLGAQIDIFVDSALAMVDNMLPRVGVALEGVGELIEKGLPKVLDLAISIIDKNLPKLTESALTLVKKVFDSLVKNLPTIVKTVSSVIVKLAKSIAKELPKAIPALVDGVLEVITSIVDELPTFLDALLELVDGLVQGLINAIPRIIQALPKLIQGIVDFIVKAIPKIVEAAGKLLGGIIEAIPNIVVEIGKAMPQIIAAIVGGLIAGAGSVAQAIGEVLGIIPSKASEAGSSISEYLSSVSDLGGLFNDVNPKIADYNQLISDQGHTLSDLDDMTRETEDKITEILRGAYDDQRGLREDEISELETYLDDLARIQEEKLEIYRSQQVSELKKIQLETDDITKENAAQYLSNLQETLNKANEITNEAYTTELTQLERLYDNGKGLSDEEYASRLKDLKDSNAARKKENQKYYDDAVTMLQEKTGEMIDLSSEGWRKIINASMDARINEEVKAEGAFTDKVGAFVTDFFGGYKDDWEAGMKTIDVAAANGYLQMIATIRANGGELSEENQKTVNRILNVFADLPDYLQDDAKASIMALITGMDSQLPELRSASGMTADQIIQTLRKVLLNDSTGTYATARDAMEGVNEGIDSKKSSLIKTAKGVANSVLNAMRTTLEISSPSKVFRDVIGKNIVLGLSKGLDEYAYYAYDSMNALSEGLTASVETDIGGAGTGRPRGGVSVVQNIYAQEMSPAEAFEEAMNQQERWYFLNV